MIYYHIIPSLSIIVKKKTDVKKQRRAGKAGAALKETDDIIRLLSFWK